MEHYPNQVVALPRVAAGVVVEVGAKAGAVAEASDGSDERANGDAARNTSGDVAVTVVMSDAARRNGNVPALGQAALTAGEALASLEAGRRPVTKLLRPLRKQRRGRSGSLRRQEKHRRLEVPCKMKKNAKKRRLSEQYKVHGKMRRRISEAACRKLRINC